MSELRPSDSPIDEPEESLSTADASAVTLITGASGFIGRHLVSALAGDGHGLTPPSSVRRRRIHVIARQSDLTFDGVDPRSITIHRIDLMNSGEVSDLMGRLRPTELFHLAWFNGESASRYRDPKNFDWVAVAENLVETFALHGGRRAILTGSCIEYGAVGGVLSENDRPDPDTVYGRCKLDAGQRALAVAQDYPHLTVAVARVFFVLGRYEDPNRLVPHIIRQLMMDQPAELSAGTQRRDYMHAWDVALGLIAIADSSLNGFVNLGMGSSIAVKELSEIVGDAVGRPDLLWFGKRAGGADAASEITADISRLTAETGWRPTLDLEAACADVVNWWRASLNPAAGTAK